MFQPFSKTVSWKSSMCLSVSTGAPGYREGLRMEARKQRPLTGLLAASPELGQLLIHGRERLSHADAAVPRWLHRAPSSDVSRELGTLVKSPNRKLAVLQTGLQAVGSRMSGSGARPRHLTGKAPKTRGQSVFQLTPLATLRALQPDAKHFPGLWTHRCCGGSSHRPLCSETPHTSAKAACSGHLLRAWERKVSRSSCLTGQLWG